MCLRKVLLKLRQKRQNTFFCPKLVCRQFDLNTEYKHMNKTLISRLYILIKLSAIFKIAVSIVTFYNLGFDVQFYTLSLFFEQINQCSIKIAILMKICLLFDVWIVFLQTATFAFVEREQLAITENKKYKDFKHEKRSN